MGKIDNIELRKQKNAPFCKAFDYIAELKEVSDKVLAELIGSKGPYISMYRAGTKPVPMEIMENLVRQSGGELNMEYLRCNSEYMLLRNVPDDEMVEMQLRKGNPDYEVIRRAKEKGNETQIYSETGNIPTIDPSSQQNASIVAYVQLANRLDEDLKKKEIEMQERLAEKDATIESQKAQIARLELSIADKDIIIKDREARIVTLERQLNAISVSNPEKWPFTVGVADEGDRPRSNI